MQSAFGVEHGEISKAAFGAGGMTNAFKSAKKVEGAKTSVQEGVKRGADLGFKVGNGLRKIGKPAAIAGGGAVAGAGGATYMNSRKKKEF